MVVSAEGGVGAGAVTEFEGLMLGDGNGGGGSDAGVCLKGGGSGDTIEAGLSTVPVVAVEGEPEAWLGVVA